MSKHKKPTFWSQYQPTRLAISLVVLIIFATSFAIGMKLEGMRGGLLIAKEVKLGMMQKTVATKNQLDEKYLQQKMHGVSQEEKIENAMKWRDEDLLFMFLVLTFFVLTLLAHLLLYSMNRAQNALLKQKMDHIARSSRSKLRITTKQR